MIATADGPIEVLGELSRRLGLGYSRTFVTAQVAGHAAPGSLAALVEVGGALGLAISARRCDSSERDDTLRAVEPSDLPLVVHLGDGFGVIVGVDDAADRVVLWGTAQGERAVERTEVAAAWSGVFAVVTRDPDGGVREPGRWRHKLGERVFAEWRPPIELAGARGSAWARAVVFGGAIALAVIGGPALLAAACAVGLFTAHELTRASAGNPSKLCAARGRIDCRSVLGSIYANVAGVPVSSIALALFGAATVVLGAAGLASPSGAAACSAIVGGVYVAALPAVAFFALAQLRLRTLCTLCAIAHGAIVAGAVVALARGGWPPLTDLAAPAALFALAFAVIVAAVAPHVHRTDAADRDAARLAALLALPEATLAELLASPRTDLPAQLGFAAGDPAAPVEIVAFVHPLCPACGETLAAIERALVARPDRLRAAIAITPARRAALPTDRAMCDALTALGAHVPYPAWLAVVRALKREPARLAHDPIGMIAEHTGLDRDALIALAATAHDTVARVTAAAASLDGVPAVFVAGRRTRAPLAHAIAWAADPRLPRER